MLITLTIFLVIFTPIPRLFILFSERVFFDNCVGGRVYANHGSVRFYPAGLSESLYSHYCGTYRPGLFDGQPGQKGLVNVYTTVRRYVYYYSSILTKICP